MNVTENTPTPRTHLAIDADLCGRPVAIAPGRSTVELLLTECMKADAHGLVHGGFIFGAADFAAMLAVNEPMVVLGSAQVGFLKPSRVGERLCFVAKVAGSKGRRHEVEVHGTNAAGETVFSGTFKCVVPDSHVLEGS
ncbi:MAG TPA: PaaI family thioesterase [Kiritimatiellia bacterium]|nr:PaaI family thioesterase [Rhodoferax sp.]HPR69434.1 PaaI family thioesterase [Kiritimatiellia bacterium]